MLSKHDYRHHPSCKRLRQVQLNHPFLSCFLRHHGMRAVSRLATNALGLFTILRFLVQPQQRNGVPGLLLRLKSSASGMAKFTETAQSMVSVMPPGKYGRLKVLLGCGRVLVQLCEMELRCRVVRRLIFLQVHRGAIANVIYGAIRCTVE